MFRASAVVSLVPLEVQNDYRGLPELVSKEIGESLERSDGAGTAHRTVLECPKQPALAGSPCSPWWMLALFPPRQHMQRECRALALGGFGVFILTALTIAAFASAGERLTSILLLPMAFTVGILFNR